MTTRRLHLNESRHGCSPLVRAAIWEAAANGEVICYADGDGRELRDALAAHHGLDASNVLLFNGSIEALFWMIMASAARSCILPTPTYSGYDPLLRHLAIRPEEIPLYDIDPTHGTFGQPLAERLYDACAGRPEAVCLLAEPNNPTGSLLPAGTLADLSATYHDALFMIDEAYADFAPISHDELVRTRDNVIVVRTFSKSYGLAGLRIGYALVPDALRPRLSAFRLPYCLDAIAVAAALAALEDRAWLDRTLCAVRRERARLTQALTRCGHSVSDSHANFVLAAIAGDAAAFARKAAERGLLLKQFGDRLAHCVRVTVGDSCDNDAFIEALA